MGLCGQFPPPVFHRPARPWSSSNSVVNLKVGRTEDFIKAHLSNLGNAEEGAVCQVMLRIASVPGMPFVYSVKNN